MKRGFGIVCGVVLVILGGSARGQDEPAAVDVGPGIKMRVNGIIDVGDITGELGHFDSSWTVSEQHDVFNPADQQPAATQPSSHIVSGTFASAGGSFNLVEETDPEGDGIRFTANVTSGKEVDTNELYMSFSLPVKLVGGKEMMLDDQPTLLPAEPAKQGEAQIAGKDGVHEIDIPTPTGTLIFKGNLSMLLQDDREWGDDRFSLRLNFSPSSGPIKQSKIEFQMIWKPSGK
jgi:hypothetical protein